MMSDCCPSPIRDLVHQDHPMYVMIHEQMIKHEANMVAFRLRKTANRLPKSECEYYTGDRRRYIGCDNHHQSNTKPYLEIHSIC